MTAQDIKPNMVFRYSSGAWCRHGLAITRTAHDGTIGAVDTYWRDPSMDPVSISTLETSEFLGCLDDFKKSDRDECDRYDSSDVIFIPIGGGGEQWWLRKDAAPNRGKVIGQLSYKIEGAEARIRSLRRDVERWSLELGSITPASQTSTIVNPNPPIVH